LAGRAEEEDPASSLLSDIHIEFKTLKVDRIHSKVLVMELNKLPGRPWAGRSKGADADMRWLLSPLGAPASRWRF
jgi:hypothetical protein